MRERTRRAQPVRRDPRRVEKPWGWELVWAEAEAYVGKLLRRAGQSLSLQYHEVKDEAWLVQEGPRALELGELEGSRDGGDHAGRCVPLPARDRAPRDRDRGHPGSGGLDPHLDDVVRLEDRYGREGTSAS